MAVPLFFFPAVAGTYEMPLASMESNYCVQDGASRSCFLTLRGRGDILRMQALLIALSARCGQTGAMDYLEYFLTLAENIRKIPHVVLVTSRPVQDVFQVQPEDLAGAVLVYEYKLLGVASRLFSTGDLTGFRSVIAPAAERASISAGVCRYLVEDGARIVLLSVSAGTDTNRSNYLESAGGEKQFLWTTQHREVGASLVLEDTFDGTLTHLGSHTRRNLRYYRRKAEAELACTFANDVRGTLTRTQFMELNQASTHPVASSALDRRYATLKSLEGGFCVGVRSSDGEWVSLVAGRRHYGITEIDWQMNRSSMARYSIGTVIRSYLIEHEVALGMKRLFFEGGTPHTIRHSFVPETAVDIIATRRSTIVSMLRRGTALLRLRNNFLLQVLVNPTLQWELH